MGGALATDTRRAGGTYPTVPTDLGVAGAKAPVALALVFAAAVMAGVAACGRISPGPQATPSEPFADATSAPATGSAVDYPRRQAVCAAFARALLSIDTVTDSSRNDALNRVAPLATDSLLAAVPSAVPDFQWQEWAQHRSRTVVIIGQYAGDDAPAPWSSVAAAVTPVGQDGWRGPTSRLVVHCAVAVVGEGHYRVSSYELEPMGQ